MRIDNVPRVMWLLNHTSARKFEIPMLKSIGFGEIFLPKIYPNDPSFRSASVDWSEDQNLTIPADDLAILNEADWYRGATRKAWDVANKYFDYAFFIVVDRRCAENIARYFKGAALWRTYGLAGKGNSYSLIMQTHRDFRGVFSTLESMGKRLWFAEAYDHLHLAEEDSIASRAIYIPLGLKGAESAISEDWTGKDERILFVCPDIGINTVYADIYKDFRRDFKSFPYAIGGSQAVTIDDPKVLGFLPLEEHQKNMREMRVMYYHSREPRHIHFHPFEAIRAGMPLVFQGGGILDKMGGKKMPGRCSTVGEAKRKIRRILDGDRTLINSIRSTQPRLLDGMIADNLREYWRSAFARISSGLSEIRDGQVAASDETNRIAMLTSSSDAELSLSMAQSLVNQAREEDGRSLEVVLGVSDTSPGRLTELEEQAGSGVSIRRFHWRTIKRAEAERSLLYKGNDRELTLEEYLVPEDGSNDFFDCGVWIARIAGQGFMRPVLPLRPIILSVTRLGHRFMPHGVGPFSLGPFGLEMAPERVLVDSEFAYTEITRNEGVSPRLVRLIDPPEPFHHISRNLSEPAVPFFAWAMEVGGAIDIEKTIASLVAYYDECGGQLASRIVLGENFGRGDFDLWRKLIRDNPTLLARTQVRMFDTDDAALEYLAKAEFVWRPNILGDDRLIRKLLKGGVMAVAADCPVLRSNSGAGSCIAWADFLSAASMAEKIRDMELREKSRRTANEKNRESGASISYWKAVSECL